MSIPVVDLSRTQHRTIARALRLLADNDWSVEDECHDLIALNTRDALVIDPSRLT